MDVTTTTCDAKTARRKLKVMHAARNRLGEKFSADDHLLLMCYRELAAGRRLIDVNKSFQESGLNRAGFPKFAIARADRRRVFCDLLTRDQLLNDQWVRIHNGGAIFNYYERRVRGERNDHHQWQVPANTFDPHLVGESRNKGNQICAMVPYIPAHLRPTRGLGSYFILFEANWFWASSPPISSPDPLLLKQIQGPLMAVHAVWDLTGLEQQIFDAASFFV